MNEKQRGWLAWGIVAVVLTIISIVLGVSYPVPPAPGGDIEALGTTQFANLYVVGTSDLRGNVSDGGGVFTFADNVLLDGAADAIQLTVQGYTTQTTSLLVLENSGGTDQFTVGNGGELYVLGTSDLRGNVSDGGGVFTFADNVMLDGAADAIQLLVQGYTTQTTSLLVLENSGGTDQFTVGNTGNLYAAGTSDLRGNVSDGGGDFTIADNAVITGTANIQGNVSDSGGVFTFADNVMLDGAADAIQLLVQGYTTQTTSLLVLENSGGTDQFTFGNTGNLYVAGTFDLRGDVSDGGGNFTIADNAVITGTLDVAGASLQYGPNNLYPLGVDTSGFEVEWGVDTITGTLAVTHGLTSPVIAICTLVADPGTGAGDGAFCTATVSGATVTIKVWQDDFTAATVGWAINWVVIGTP